MSRGWINLAIVLAATTVSAIQLPDAQPPIFSSRAELVVVHASTRRPVSPNPRRRRRSCSTITARARA